jgi:hypothetical protein
VLLRTFAAIGAATCLCAAQNAPELGLVLRFDKSPAKFFLTGMKQELARILPGFSLHWITRPEGDGATPEQTLVIHFRGRCSAGFRPGDFETEGRITLGETALMKGQILPYSEIDCDTLARFLKNTSATEAGEESRLGIATGRVVAHELYHFLIQTNAHGKSGLTRAVHTPSGLLSSSLRFEASELEELREKVRARYLKASR